MTATDSHPHGAGEIETWFRDYIAKLVGLPVEQVAGSADFDSFGIDSVQGVDMVTALETWLGLTEDLPLEYVFEADSITEAAQRISLALPTGPSPA
ncbi:acyl carrier protein [Sphingobium sufflavum]|uniref:acyl carrier protein n=1 Tax=Sphingobium sufflavum TaxID=1129547 RepID=UPI001F40C33C|nr:acyl carrier protein [Sphingobium sufflavum]MCE7797102.1 acyl carrier protein [Sphingobium sufflavum]